MKDCDSGKLRIGDNWNAIRIIALSQSNPLKAVAEFKVEPRQFEGRLLHEVSRPPQGDLYVEVYLARPDRANAVGLYRQGTRVIESLAAQPEFARPPWTTGYLQGILDAPYLNLTPGTRSGIIQDDAYHRLTQELAPLENLDAEIVTFKAPAEPGLTRVRLTAKQDDIECTAEALITVTDWLLPQNQSKEGTKQGIPSYTFQKAPGELWRSRYQPDQNVVVINNGHRDFVFASRNKALKIRYICRLFAKELVAKNFAGLPPGDTLERLIGLSLYTEENLK